MALWAFDATSDSPPYLPCVEVLARLSPDVILLPNSFGSDGLKILNEYGKGKKERLKKTQEGNSKRASKA